MLKNRCSSVYLKIIFYFSSLFALTCNPVELSSAPNYYYSGINYSEYQTLGELEQNDQTEKIEIYLQRLVPGLSASYREVIDELITEGHHVYLRGGIIRDLLSITTSEPNDVDLDYTGDVEDLIAICEKNHWRYTHFPKRQIIITFVTFALQSLGMIVLIALGYGFELLILWFIPWWIGQTVMLTLFTWAPHHDHSETGRYRDTRESLFPGANILLLGQNHHLIHHMMPGIPFYRYSRTFKEIRPMLEKNGVRIEGFWRRRWPRDPGCGRPGIALRQDPNTVFPCWKVRAG